MDLTINITKEFLYDLVCEESQSTEISIYHGANWNLVGLPLDVDSSNVEILFPTSIVNTLFSYGQGYVQQNYLENGVGYWLRFEEEGTSTLSGQVLNEISISLNADWNLITGISEDILSLIHI